MEFDREVFDLMPSGSKTFNLIGLKMPSDKDIFFRAKQKETLDKYQAARRFMYELETDDWDHYFHKLEDENGNIYFQNVLKAQWYEAALLFYNAVVDLSWIACYISAEYFIYHIWIRIQKEQSNICKDPITLQTRHCFGLLLTTSNHLSY